MLFKVPEWEYRNTVKEEVLTREDVSEQYADSDLVYWKNKEGEIVAKMCTSFMGELSFWTTNPNFQALNVVRKLCQKSELPKQT